MRRRAVRRPARVVVVKRHVLPALLVSAFACAVPDAPLVDHDLVREVTDRGSREAAVREALALADLEPLALALPADASLAPEDDAFWHACAWAYGAAPRAARRRFRALVEASEGAGLPAPVRLEAESPDLAELDAEVTARLAFDLLGILGLGRSAAAATLASAEARSAFADAEATLWAAGFHVDRARARLAAARARTELLLGLVAEAKTDARRMAHLDERGWVAPSQAAAARALLARLDRRLAAARTEEAERAADLAAAAGLPPNAPALAAIAPATLSRFHPESPLGAGPDGAALLAGHPRLRAARLAYAVAEAEVRAAAAQAWPEIGVGPRISVQPDTTLVGGVVGISLPWPGTVSSQVAAALERRGAARERAEEALRDQLATVAAGRARLDEARRTLAEHAPAIETETAAAWRGARARFSVDALMLMQWNDAFERRIDGVTARAEAREAAILAWLDYREACGPGVEEARR